MLKPILYYALFSSPSRACLLTAKLIHMNLELKPINFALRENLAPWFLKINPRHTVPVLIDCGVPVCDSHAIMTYMVSQYSKDDTLYPNNRLMRAKVDELLYYENGVLFQCVKEFVRRILYGGDTEYNPKSIKMCRKAYALLESYLEHNPFVAGRNMTIADLSINTTLVTLSKIVPLDEKVNSKIVAWVERMKTVPEYYDVNEQGAYQLYARILAGLTENRLKLHH